MNGMHIEGYHMKIIQSVVLDNSNFANPDYWSYAKQKDLCDEHT